MGGSSLFQVEPLTLHLMYDTVYPELQGAWPSRRELHIPDETEGGTRLTAAGCHGLEMQSVHFSNLQQEIDIYIQLSEGGNSPTVLSLL